jgi:hypothetical protein
VVKGLPLGVSITQSGGNSGKDLGRTTRNGIEVDSEGMLQDRPKLFSPFLTISDQLYNKIGYYLRGFWG